MRSAIQLGFFRSTKTTLQLLWLGGAFGFLPFDAAAQVTLPPVNLGTTSFEDGIAFPGWLIEEMPNYYRATDWRDSHGNTIPGANSATVISSMTHVAYISKLRVLGGYYAA